MNGSTLASPTLLNIPGSSPSVWSGSQVLSRILGITALQRRYMHLPRTNCPEDFAEAALRALNVDVAITGEALSALPASGPLLFVANHPFGGAEGLAVAAQCGRIRPDLKILANSLLCGIAELRSMLIPVDVSGNDATGNVSGVRAAVRHLEAGGTLAVFPAGMVAHWQADAKCVTDPEWHSFAGRLARTPHANIVPLHFQGRNSLFFQLAGCLHPMLRTLLLPRELWRLRGRTVRLAVGRTVESGCLSAFANDAARTAHLRARCEILGRKGSRQAKVWSVPVAVQENPAALRAEVDALPVSACLVNEGDYAVYAVRGKHAPHLLREVGRLRELSFRQLEEGSDQARDLDRYDPEYTHLVLWDTRRKIMAGGYRVRCFFPSEAPKASAELYTASLFRFHRAFFEECGVSMELGRAFVAPEHQRDYAPLLLLWKGIARLAAMAGVRVLFGPSSISLNYAPESIQMLRQYLQEQHWDAELAPLVKGRLSPKDAIRRNAPNAIGLDYRACNRAVKDLEGDKGLPILFKHYLQLGGRIAAFHEDRRFGTLDALLVVDLARTPDKLLLRYLSVEQLRVLREKHMAV